MTGIKIVEPPGIGGDSGAALYPETQKVAAHRKRRAVAQDRPGPIDGQCAGDDCYRKQRGSQTVRS
jgi:hypothetical protein